MRSYQKELEEFRRQGVVVIEGVLTDADYEPVRQELATFIDSRARELHAAGRIQNLCEDDDFEHRCVRLYQQCPDINKGLDIMLIRGRAMFEFLHNDHLLELAEAFLGPEITCNPIQHIRAKMPSAGETADGFMNVPWHQDAAVTLPEADPSTIYTFWTPMVDATVETGCMQVIPRCVEGGLLPHIAVPGSVEVDPNHLPDTEPITAACKKGGVVLMHKYTPHRGQSNRSSIARWTFDLRYQKTGEPTGRPFHPDFVVRSRKNPSSVRRDYDWWCRAWEEALRTSAGKVMHRVGNATLQTTIPNR